MSTNTLFLHIKGFTGNTPPKDIKEWMPLEGASMNVFSSARIDGSSGKVSNDGAPHFENIPMTKRVDERTPAMTAKIAEATEIEEVVIKVMTKLGSEDKELVRWTFKKCLFVAQNISVKNNGGVPSEDLSMAYDSVHYKVSVPVDAKNNKDGEMSWSNVENTKL
ncbi:type VI secretion system tube protein Hcp [Pantoea sp. SO10]|uniref:type VI secretion system tube protein Hcp n=1 Tax=Pantoea sp. SO10 TaxID=2575375 RepID=UPI0010C9C0BC|nr:type VI secretion system tube protein Hcp [Pantoea sp. SO10]QCP59325.1 type VI secretion system tube protein Hcp [Pantoea sp. SO10]